MDIKLSDYIFEQSISNASVQDIDIEQCFAQLEVQIAVLESTLKKMEMQCIMEAGVPAQQPAPDYAEYRDVATTNPINTSDLPIETQATTQSKVNPLTVYDRPDFSNYTKSTKAKTTYTKPTTTKSLKMDDADLFDSDYDAYFRKHFMKDENYVGSYEGYKVYYDPGFENYSVLSPDGEILHTSTGSVILLNKKYYKDLDNYLATVVHDAKTLAGKNGIRFFRSTEEDKVYSRRIGIMALGAAFIYVIRNFDKLLCLLIDKIESLYMLLKRNKNKNKQQNNMEDIMTIVAIIDTYSTKTDKLYLTKKPNISEAEVTEYIHKIDETISMCMKIYDNPDSIQNLTKSSDPITYIETVNSKAKSMLMKQQNLLASYEKQLQQQSQKSIDETQENIKKVKEATERAKKLTNLMRKLYDDIQSKMNNTNKGE